MTTPLKDTGRSYGIKGLAKLPAKLASAGVRAFAVDAATADDTRPIYLVLLNNGETHKVFYDGYCYVSSPVDREAFTTAMSAATA